MNMNVSKTNGVKLLAAVMVMAMVVAGATVVISDSEADAFYSNYSGDSIITLTSNVTENDEGYTFDQSTGTLILNGYNGTKGFYYAGALKIIVKGSNSITVDTQAAAGTDNNNGTRFAAIATSSGSAIDIDGDNSDDADKLTITVNGVTNTATNNGGSEWSYGILSGGALTIDNLEIDVDVGINDKFAFAIAANGASTFTNVTGSVDGGNRAVQVGNHTFTLKGCEMTFTGGEKAIQANNASSEVVITSNGGTHSNIVAKLNGSYGGPQSGQNDGYGVKARVLQVDANNSLTADGIHVFNVGTSANAKLNGNVTVNSYTYAFSDKVTGNYTPGFTVDNGTSVAVGDSNNAAKLTINSKATFDGNVTVKAEATAEINNTVSGTAKLTNNGTLLLGNAGDLGEILDRSSTGTVASTITQTGTSTGLQNYIDSDFTIPSGGAFLTQNLTIKSGATLTVPARAELNLNGYSLIVEGTLAVERNGVVAALGTQAGETAEGILLGANGAIENNGVIGTGIRAVTVGVNGNAAGGTVEMLNVTGVSFNLIRDGTPGAYKYYLGVTGDVSRSTGTAADDDKILTINGAIVNGDLTTSRDVVLGGTFSVARNGTVTTNGEITTGAIITLQNGSIINVNGAFDGKIVAETEEGLTSAEANNTEYDISDATTFESKNGTSVDSDTDTDTVTVTGFTVSVSRVQYTADNGDIMFNQRAYISGTIGLSVTGTNYSAPLAVTGNLFVAEDETVVLGNGVTITTATATDRVIVQGTVQNVSNYDKLNFVGAYYEVTAEGQTTAVGYITTFDNAMSAIADADDDLIYLSGAAGFEVEVAGTYTLASEQTIDIKGTAPYIIIAETGTITVEDGAMMDESVISKINGKLVVMYGGDCTPASSLYDVMSTNDAGDITYAGLQVVLNGAQPGDEVTVTGQNATATSINVPNGVTLTITNGAKLTVDRSVTVAEGGVLNVEGTLEIGKNDATGVKAIPGTLTVNGTADITEGTLTMTGGSSASKTTISSTGSLVYNSRNNLSNTESAAVNGAYYLNADGDNVLTTFSKAVAGAMEADTVNVTVIGTVSDAADVVLGGAKVTVQGTATLGNIDVTSSTVDVNGGALTATIVGQTGVDGSTTQSAFQLVGAKIVGITNTSAVNSQNQTVWSLVFGVVTDGSVTISQGTVSTAADMTGSEENNSPADSLVVADGATLTITGDVTISGYKTITVNGTLDVAANGGDLEVTVTGEQKFTVAGTMDVNGAADVSSMVLTGTLNVNETETSTGSMSVSGVLSVGEATGTLGATGTVVGDVALTGTASYVLAYPGTTVDIASFGDNAKTTQFYINGTLYVTAYTDNDGNVVAIGDNGFMADVEITGFVTEDSDGTVINDVENWFSDAAMETKLVETGTAFDIGDEETAYIQLDPANAKIQYSVGSGISLYVDGIRVESGSTPVDISVGTHTVTATVNPGYAGEVTITFNGQAVTGGSFEVTPEMAKAGATAVVLSATGNITVDTGSSGNGPHRDPPGHPGHPDRRHGHHGRPQADEELKVLNNRTRTRVRTSYEREHLLAREGT